MHVTERSDLIMQLLNGRSFVGLQDFCDKLSVSPATVHRDLERLEENGRIQRVRGGARAMGAGPGDRLVGAPFDLNRAKYAEAKAAIGRAAAQLCDPGEAIIIDGGTTTFEMCPHLGDLHLQVLTNSLHIVGELLRQPGTRVSVPGGSIFREQNIILSPFEDDGLRRYHASKMFMGAAAVGAKGLMQADAVLVQAERKLLERADKLILLVDSSKLRASASFLVCSLAEVDTIVVDGGITDAEKILLRGAVENVIVAA